MTRDETIKILMVIQAAYPNYKPQDKTVAVNVWTDMLSDIPYEKVSTALKAYIQMDEKGFAPSIGDIRSKIQMLFSKEDELNETEAWALVLKAIRRSAYYSEEEFEKLPPIVQKAVASPKQLREWATLEDVGGNSLTVLQSNFQRTYRAEQKRSKEKEQLSPDVAKLLRERAHPKIRCGKPPCIEDEIAQTEEHAVPAPDNLIERISNLFENKDFDD